MLEHDALAADAFVLAQSLCDLVERANERALRVRREPIVEAALALDARVELLRTLERVGVGVADQAACHRRVVQRASGGLARLLYLRPDARELLRRFERRVVL